jgi:predicted N-acyltransferase
VIRRLLRWLIGWQETAQNQPLPLEGQLAVLKTEFEQMRQEWADVQDWLHRLTARENARKRKAIKAAMETAETQGSETTSGGEIVDPGAGQAAGMSRKAYLRSLVHQNGGRR